MMRKEQLVLTAVWRNGGFSASYDSFVVGSSAVLRLNFCAKNPPPSPSRKTLCLIVGRPCKPTDFDKKTKQPTAHFSTFGCPTHRRPLRNQKS